MSDRVDDKLIHEIDLVGFEARETLRKMALAFTDAMRAIEQAARAWEEAAPLR